MLGLVMREYPRPTSAAVTAVMKGNRRRDTKPELRLRRILHARGHRYRVDRPIRLTQRSVQFGPSCPLQPLLWNADRYR